MKKIKYIIYTENIPQLRSLLDRYLPGYTIFIGEGHRVEQNGQSVMVIYISDVADITIARLISHILLDCNQNSVYLQTEEIHIKEFIKPKVAA